MTRRLTTETVTLNLGSGRSYALRDDKEMLAALAPAILSHLGCSFEIKWPDEDPAQRTIDRHHRIERRNQLAEEHALRSAPLDSDEDALAVVRDAFVAGWNAAPKPVRDR